MKRGVVRLALVAAGAAAAAGLTTSAEAWTPVAYPAQIGPWGPEAYEITLTQYTRAKGRRYTSHRVHTQTTFNNGPYDVSASALCSLVGWRTTTAYAQYPQDKLVEAECPSGTVYITGGGAIHNNN